MLTLIPDLIDAATVHKLRSWMSEATFEDGRATAGGDAARVKRNEQVSGDPNRHDPHLEQMQDLVEDALWDSELLKAAARPKEFRPPLFSRYTPGMSYGVHMDNAGAHAVPLRPDRLRRRRASRRLRDR
jgi:PKHD-type hydroxylase